MDFTGNIQRIFNSILSNMWGIVYFAGLNLVEPPITRSLSGIVPEPFGDALVRGVGNVARFSVWDAVATKV